MRLRSVVASRTVTQSSPPAPSESESDVNGDDDSDGSELLDDEVFIAQLDEFVGIRKRDKGDSQVHEFAIHQIPSIHQAFSRHL